MGGYSNYCDLVVSIQNCKTVCDLNCYRVTNWYRLTFLAYDLHANSEYWREKSVNKWGIASIIAFVIIVGLLLRYGRDTVSVLGVGGNQVNTALQTLTLSGLPGNA